MKNKIIPIFAVVSIILSFLSIFKVDAVFGEETINFWQRSEALSSFPGIALVICAVVNLVLYFIRDMKDFTVLHLINPVGNIVFIFWRLFNLKNTLNELAEGHIAILGWVFLIASAGVAYTYFSRIGSSGSSDTSSGDE